VGEGYGSRFLCDIQLQERKGTAIHSERSLVYEHPIACDITREVDHHFMIRVVGILSNSRAEMIFVDL